MNTLTGPMWDMFVLIAGIPHCSGNEMQLGNVLCDFARIHGLQAEKDAAGNVRIVRPAVNGMEHAPRLILQGHLDMVPQSNDPDFNFTSTPISPIRNGAFLETGGKTTLGADNGIGVAAAMVMLLDRTVQCGELSAVFTVEEETGLKGARNLAGDWLDADYLLNLDSEDEGELFVGCAGGARVNTRFSLRLVPAEGVGVTIRLSGLPGGHSGCDIHKKRGNANSLMAELLLELPCHVASLDGGTLDNAIPRECVCVGTVPEENWKDVQNILQEKQMAFAARLGDAGKNLKIELEKTETPTMVWDSAQQHTILTALAHCPNGPFAYNNDFPVVETSSNLAIVKTEEGVLSVHSSQRSLVDDEREAASQKVMAHFGSAGGISEVSSAYPGWSPVKESPLLATANRVYERLFGVTPANTVIHAGLECGIFAGINPELQMISFGPDILDPHSPAERLSIDGAERFLQFLRALIEELCRKKQDVAVG